MLLVTVAVCYLLFFHSQTKEDNQADAALTADMTGTSSPAASPGTAHSQYKEAMDRAHAAAKAMQDERKEADSY